MNGPGKFVIVKHMKELRFGGGVNPECADLWIGKHAWVGVTMLPICVSVNPQNQTLCNKRSRTLLCNFFSQQHGCSLSSAVS